jgi:hypothetical protein
LKSIQTLVNNQGLLSFYRQAVNSDRKKNAWIRSMDAPHIHPLVPLIITKRQFDVRLNWFLRRLRTYFEYTGKNQSLNKRLFMKRPLKIFLFTAALFMTLACTTITGGVENNNKVENNIEVNNNNEVEPTESSDAVTPENTILFQDDFSDPDSGWDRADWDSGTTDYDNGVYRLMVKVSNYDIWANPGRYFEGDVRVEVDATKVSGENDDDFGLICRYSGEPSAPNYYYFQISSDGYAVIGKVTAGDSEYISGNAMSPNDAIYQGKTTNHLRADCIGNSLTFYVNGQMVIRAKDSDFTDGDIGLMGGTFDIPSAEFSFDNLVVTEP